MDEKVEILRRAGAVFIEEIRAGLYDQIWVAFAVLLPLRTVGANRARSKNSGAACHMPRAQVVMSSKTIEGR